MGYHSRTLPALAPLGAVVALLLAVPACRVSPAPAAPAEASPAHPGGALFSAIPCASTPLGTEWAKLRPEAAARFPSLRLTEVADLHVTVVYLGRDWKLEDLDRIRAHALEAPREPAPLRPEAVRMGRDGQVVAVELHGAPESWAAAVVAAKAVLNALALKKPDAYDGTFRPHVTVASARKAPPDAEEAASLDAFRAWLAERIAADAGRFEVKAGPSTRVRLWLAGTPRPPGATAYVDLEDALARR